MLAHYALMRSFQPVLGAYSALDLGHFAGFVPGKIVPIIQLGEGNRRDVAMVFWGRPRTRPPEALHTIEDLNRPDMQGRCLVPATSFAIALSDARKDLVWFAMGEGRPLICLAGVWGTITRSHKVDTSVAPFLSVVMTEANHDVRALGIAAVPVVLPDRRAWARWLSAPAEELPKLQRPIALGRLKVVARGVKNDWVKPID